MVDDQRCHRRLFVVGIVVLCLGAAAIPLPVLAQSDDTSAPTLTDAQRGDDTTIVVTIADDQDVDESSISLSDFAVSTGLLGNVSINESGSDATVALSLVNPVDSDNVTVSLAGSVSDTTGNTVSEGSATATGMDSRQPRLLGFSVDRLNETDGRIVVETNEPLSDLTLAIGGANAGNFGIENFTETEARGGTLRYTRVHRFDEEGESGLLLMRLTDDSDNGVSYNVQRSYLTDRTPPTAAIEGPEYVTTGDTHTFRSGAADNVGIESIQWSLGPNATRAGQSVTSTFTDAGNRTIEVTVTDGRNQTVTVEHNVTVVAGANKNGVAVTPVAANRTNATVAAERATRRVRIADDRGRIVSNDGVAVESITLSPPANESIDVSVAVSPRARAFTAATGQRSVASFSIDHASEDTGENVSIAFAVDRSRLQAVGIAPSDVSLYRLDGNWTELPTRVRWIGPDRVHLLGNAPSMSTFAIGAANDSGTANDGTNETVDGTTQTDGDTTEETNETNEAGDSTTPTQTATRDPPSLVVTGATLLDDTVHSGEYAVVSVTVANRGGQTGTRTLTLSANGSAVSTSAVTVAPGENRTVQIAARLNSTVELVVDGTKAGTVAIEDTAGTGGSAMQTTVADESTDEPPSTSTVTATTTARNATAAEAGGGGLPNPLSLWPGGIVGTILAVLIGIVTVGLGVLKGLAIYLGY